MDDPRLLPPIPTPPAQRLREVRLIFLPRAVFVAGVLVAAWLWMHAVAPGMLVAEADIHEADARSPRAGMVASLAVGTSQEVHAGDVVGYVTPSVSRLLALSPPPEASKESDGTPKPAESATAPVAIVAQIDGVVSLVVRQPGQMVAAGEPVLRITSSRATRLTGFLRQPLPFDPKPGMLAEVRTRGTSSATAVTTITGVGATMEAIPPGLLAAMRLSEKNAPEPALRIHFAMPAGLSLRPGEHVDVLIHY